VPQGPSRGIIASVALELDYDQLVFLDAEGLAEGGIKRAYDALRPKLEQYVSAPAEIEESLDDRVPSHPPYDAPRYAVTYRGREYVIYSPELDDDLSEHNESWGRATYALFSIVNDQLTGEHRFFAINGGNDLGGMFLTPAEAEAARTSLPRKMDWPYLPTPDGPWYGQHHD
jgi:hypothetical protein